MCGIFGIVTNREQELGPVLADAARRLSYRGYDSVGCATFHADHSVDLRKDKGKVDDVASRLGFAGMTGVRGITQLRWATFGTPSTVNAQPHIDSDGDLVGAHNGNVVNNVELRLQFAAEGMTVRSENDGESCVHAVERWFDRGFDMVEAIRRAYGDLQGDYAFVIGHVKEDKLYAIKKGSGLVVGLTDDTACVSSDLPSILPLTRRILRIQDGEIAILSPGSVELVRVADGVHLQRDPEEIVETMEAAQKGGYPHFMLKEIHEQPQVARELLHLLDASVDVAGYVEKMRKARHLYLVACGTSYHACMLGAVYLARLAGRAAVPVLAPQFIAQYGPALGPEDVGVFVSQSGETKDVLNALNVARERGVEVLSLVNVIGSTLMVTADRYLPLACGYEISVPATKTFLNQVVAFLYLAMRMGGHPTAMLYDLPRLIETTLQQVGPHIHDLEDVLLPWQDTYCLGYGATYPIALEGALKLKEVTYIHCEGMLSTEFKHGPLSAVSDEYPVIFVAGPENVPLIVSGINEVSCRGGRTIIIGEEDPRLRANGHDLLVLPKSGPLFSPILGILPLQLLAYRVSVAKGFDPDFPRNLSKTLTVD
ncbi:MAG TPA: glutamine--fructose-6-phosphate transaminase (isomerizing) [Thermoanaerobaculaceae bacterium]|nr:glutamine--fructose-6-phosphate transaminase (isomerizing) [Thermoanaerobaculaceae bacterium]HPS77043.1 glutamine--fructose-6-phosphate transaminase (isomerizing) [Thermoanaerobaculaceae bacterium]